MGWHTIMIEVEPGTGDLGTNWKCVWDGRAAKLCTLSAAKRLADAGHNVCVFKGRNIGRLIAEFTGRKQPHNGLHQNESP